MELRRSFRGSMAILPTLLAAQALAQRGFLPTAQDGTPVAMECTLTASFHQH